MRNFDLTLTLISAFILGYYFCQLIHNERMNNELKQVSKELSKAQQVLDEVNAKYEVRNEFR